MPHPNDRVSVACTNGHCADEMIRLRETISDQHDEIERLRAEIKQLQNVLGLAIHELHGMESDELHHRYWALMNSSFCKKSQE